MELSRSIDLYCERVDASFWSEPINALSNSAFIVAAWLLAFALRRMQRKGQDIPPVVRVMPVLLTQVGVCSFLFHTFATVATGLADQFAILLFGCVFLFAFLRQLCDVSWPVALTVSLGFGLISYLTPKSLPSGFLNQSGAYFPYLLGLVGMLVWLYVQHRKTSRLFLAGVILFCVALTLRSIDQWICPMFPVGTHFLWHLLNGAVLLLLSLSLAQESAAPANSLAPSGRESIARQM